MQGARATLAAMAVMFVAHSGVTEEKQRSTHASVSLEQTIEDYNSSTTESDFDIPMHYMTKKQAFDFVRRAVHETENERMWAYVPGKLVLIGRDSNSDDMISNSDSSIEFDKQTLMTLMKEYSEMDLLHVHNAQYFSCIGIDTEKSTKPQCRDEFIKNLKRSVSSVHDLLGAVIAANDYNSIQPSGWRLNNLVFTPVSEIQYNGTKEGVRILNTFGVEALEVMIGLAISNCFDSAERIIPKQINTLASMQSMRPYIKQLIEECKSPVFEMGFAKQRYAAK